MSGVGERYWMLPLTGQARVSVFKYRGVPGLHVRDEAGHDVEVRLTAGECRSVAAALLRVSAVDVAGS